MKQYDPDADGRQVDEQEASAIADAEEDFPNEPAPIEGLPHLTRLSEEKKPEKKDKDGMDKAMEILDEYMEGVPPLNPDVPNYEE